MTNTNKNLADLSAINEIEFLKSLKDEDKKVLLDLINDKNTKIQIEKRKYYHNFTARYIREIYDSYKDNESFYSHKLIITNKKHTLSIFKINYTDDISDDRINIDTNYKIKINNHPKESHWDFQHLLFGNYRSNLHHTIDNKNYDLKNKHYSYVSDTTGCTESYYDNLFNFNVIFYLDNEVLGVRSYNADLAYFLKNTNVYKPIDIYNFFSKDLEEFNKTNYDILKLLKCEQLFNWIDAYSYFNQYLDAYNTYDDDLFRSLANDVSLSRVYFITFLEDKLKSLIKPNLEILAKNGFDYELHITECRIEHNVTAFDISIDEKKPFGNFIFSRCFDYKFYGVLEDYYNHGDTFKQNIKEWDKSITELADEINKYLQHNILVAYSKLKKLSNYTMNNLNFNKIKRNNKTYLSKELQINYGYLKTNKEDWVVPMNKNENLFLVWKYNNDTLYFDYFNIYSLCVYLTKHNNNLDEIELRYKIDNFKSFNKIVYKIMFNDVYFDVELSHLEKPEIWQNKKTIDYVKELNLPANYKFSIHYGFMENNKIFLLFKFRINKNLNEEFNNVYNKIKDKIILKEIVAKKMQKK